MANVDYTFHADVGVDDESGAVLLEYMPIPTADARTLERICGKPPYMLEFYAEATHEYEPKTWEDPGLDCIVDDEVVRVMFEDEDGHIGYMYEKDLPVFLAIPAVYEFVDMKLIEADWEPMVVWEDTRDE